MVDFLPLPDVPEKGCTKQRVRILSFKKDEDPTYVSLALNAYQAFDILFLGK